MKARIYRAWNKGWVFSDYAETQESIRPTEAVLKEWLKSDAGRGYAAEFTPSRWLVVPEKTGYIAGIYTHEWRQPARPPRELVVTQVLV